MSRTEIAMFLHLLTVLLAAAPIPGPASPSTAAASTAPADYCVRQCADILVPGQNGNASLAEILADRAFGTLPGHAGDQLSRYTDLIHAPEGVDAYFPDASFGVAPGQAERTYQPRSDVTVVRDRATGVPHVTGTTRAGTMFGAGYVGAEDRLFTMDLLRHLGRGTLTPFAGGGAGNQALEQSLWRSAPYTEQDLADQIGALQQRSALVVADFRAYLDGVNAYIDACLAGRYCPGEYVLTGNQDAITNAGGPQHFTLTDIVAIGAVIGALFGGGGGAEMQSALVRVAARARYGTAPGDAVWRDLRSQNDPETVLTLHAGQSFPYGAAPADESGVVLPDPGSVRGTSPEPTPHGMSNAAVISGAYTTDGHPVAVFGPQIGYFAPQLLMVQELQGPGISARGAAFAGLNFYVLLGRGPDYAWSATSAGQDITDTYALPLCTVDGAAPTLDADHYTYRGQCLPMEELSHVNTWRSSTADPTPAGSYRLSAQRTRLGLVAWRGTVGGKPYAFTRLRSTYRHEAESAIGFQQFNDPAVMSGPSGFRTAAAQVDYAFNWFYVDDRHAAYFMSGRNPVRAAAADPNLPVRADLEWRGYDPATNTAAYRPAADHPQSTDQDYYVSWNNKQAKDFSAADGNFSFGPVQRADLLDSPIRAALTAGRRFDRASLTALVARAAVTDLRATAVLDDLLRMVGPGPEAATLSAWKADGARRVETTPGSRVYAHAAAIRLFDAWWPRLVTAMFRPAFGDDLFAALSATLPVNQSPSGRQPGPADEAQATHQGSAFQFGWWGYVDRDLRAPKFCGNGDPAACRATLLTTLRAAAAEPAATTYPGDDVCPAGDAWCADAIRQSPLGGITHPLVSWQNRPTYQQVVGFPAHRGNDVRNLAGAVTASGSQLFYPAALAVDGDPTTRWASDWSDGQWLRVDLGSSRQVARVVLSWEAAYAGAYRVETSADGTTWRAAATVTAADGGRDVVTFPPTTARYVRLTAVTRATGYGISLFEIEVYAH